MSGLKETELIILQRTSKPSCFTQLVGFGRHYQRKQTLMEAVTPKIDRFLPARTHTHAVWPRVSTKHERHVHPVWGQQAAAYTSPGCIVLNRRLCSAAVFFTRWNAGNFTGIRHQRCLTPSLCSTAQFWQRDALLKKHYTRVISTVYAWGKMRKSFPPGSKSTNKF